MTQKPNTQRYSPMRVARLAAISFSLVFMAASIHAQTWFPVAHDGDSISIPAGTVTRYGAAAGKPNGCNSSGPALAADAWATPTKLGAVVSPASLGVSDPANCYVKELDVLETASFQVVTVNGASKQVPALPVVVVKPTISCLANPASIAQLESATITSTAISPQDLPLIYSYSATSGSVSGTGPSATYTAVGASPGLVTVTCSVIDSNGNKASATTPITVLSPPVPPATSTSYVLSSDTVKPLVLTIDTATGTWTLSGGGKAVRQ